MSSLMYASAMASSENDAAAFNPASLLMSNSNAGSPSPIRAVSPSGPCTAQVVTPALAWTRTWLTKLSKSLGMAQR